MSSVLTTKDKKVKIISNSPRDENLRGKQHVSKPLASNTQSKSNPYPDRMDDIIPFPQRLMKLLSHTELSESITWLPHGKSFIILDKKKFTDEVLPRFFNEAKFTSFTRKLNRWRFKRVTKGTESGSYHHHYFFREKPKLCRRMRCQRKYEIKKKLTTVNKPTETSPAVADADRSKDCEVHHRATLNNSCNNITPQPISCEATYPMNQIKLNHLIQLRQQQQENNDMFEQVIQGALEQTRQSGLIFQNDSSSSARTISIKQKQVIQPALEQTRQDDLSSQLEYRTETMIAPTKQGQFMESTSQQTGQNGAHSQLEYRAETMVAPATQEQSMGSTFQQTRQKGAHSQLESCTELTITPIVQEPIHSALEQTEQNGFHSLVDFCTEQMITPIKQEEI